jgi:beta-N-acetylhexosaminidase
MEDLRRLAARTLCVGFDGPEPTPQVLELVRMGVGGVVLFGRNVRDPRQVWGLTRQLKSSAGDADRPWPIIAIDQEGGRVARLRQGFTDWPAMRALGRVDDEQLAHDVGLALGRELRAVGIDLDFAPVVDVDTNPANPVIGDRAISSDPAVVSRLGATLIDGLQSAGVAACAKHFPGHGDTEHDSHLQLPLLAHSMQRLREVELPPFEAAVKAGVATVMTAHVVFAALDRDYPATMSSAVLDGLLRRELRFSGVVISDDLEMKAIADHFSIAQAVTRGLNAGVDLFLVCHSPDKQRQAIKEIVAAVEQGHVPAQRLQEAAGRVENLARRFAQPPQTDADFSVLNCAQHRAIADRLRRAMVDVGQPLGDPTQWQGTS